MVGTIEGFQCKRYAQESENDPGIIVIVNMGMIEYNEDKALAFYQATRMVGNV